MQLTPRLATRPNRRAFLVGSVAAVAVAPVAAQANLSMLSEDIRAAWIRWKIDPTELLLNLRTIDIPAWADATIKTYHERSAAK